MRIDRTDIDIDIGIGADNQQRINTAPPPPGPRPPPPNSIHTPERISSTPDLLRLVLTVCEGVRDVQVDAESNTVTVTSSSPPGGSGSGPDTAELLRHLDDLGLGLTFVADARSPEAAAGKMAAPGKNAKTEGPGTPTMVVLAVVGMMCQRNCGTTVRRALEGVPGVSRAEVSFAQGRATVAWSGGSRPEGEANSAAAAAQQPFLLLLDALVGAVEAVGFGAAVVPDVVLEVEGMMCQRNCGSTVKAALEAVCGVRKAEVSFTDRRALVWSNGDGIGGGGGEGGGGVGVGGGRGGQLSAEEALVDAVGGVGFGAAVSPAAVLEVGGMMCQKNCGTTVRKALEGVPGVSRVEVSFAQGRARMWGGGSGTGTGTGTTVESAALVDAVEAVGFEAAVAPTAVLSVEGMMCQGSCGTTVKGALEAVPGVARAEVSFPEKRARVWGGGGGAAPVSVGTLVDAVLTVGFDASPAPAESPPPPQPPSSSSSATGAGVGGGTATRDPLLGVVEQQQPKRSSVAGSSGKATSDSSRRGSSGASSSSSSRSPVIVSANGEGKGGAATDGRPMLSTGSFTVEGMSCAACVGNVERFVGSMRGAGDVRVALLAGQVRQASKEKAGGGPIKVRFYLELCRQNAGSLRPNLSSACAM